MYEYVDIFSVSFFFLFFLKPNYMSARRFWHDFCNLVLKFKHKLYIALWSALCSLKGKFWVRQCKQVKRILTLKQINALISLIYFWNKTLYVSDSYSVHHQGFFTVHTAMLHVIPFCWQLARRIRTVPSDPARKLSANHYDTHHCCVYSEKLLMTDRGTVRNM